MKIHLACICINVISNTPSRMFHAEKLYLMAHLFQCLTHFKYIRFASAIRI